MDAGRAEDAARLFPVHRLHTPLNESYLSWQNGYHCIPPRLIFTIIIITFVVMDYLPLFLLCPFFPLHCKLGGKVWYVWLRHILHPLDSQFFSSIIRSRQK